MDDGLWFMVDGWRDSADCYLSHKEPSGMAGILVFTAGEEEMEIGHQAFDSCDWVLGICFLRFSL